MKIPTRPLSTLLLALIVSATPLFAATEDEKLRRQTLSISPLVIDIAGTYAPGSTINTPPIKLTNLSEATLPIKVTIKDFIAGGERGEPKVVAPTDKEYIPELSLANFIRPETTSFTLPPSGSRELRLQIVIPSDATPGGHYGLVQFTSDATASGGPVAAQGSVGTLVLLRVAGTSVETGKVASLKAFVEQAGKLKQVRLIDPMDKVPIIIGTRFQNTGNIHYKISGTIKLDNLVGGAHSLKLTPETVLPRSVRAQEARWSPLPLVAITKVGATFGYGDTAPKSASADPYYVVIFPWKLALGILVVILLFVWRDRRREKRFRKMLERSKSSDTAELG